MAFVPSTLNVPSSSTSQGLSNLLHFRRDRFTWLQMASGQEEYVKADDGEALQALFASHCDKDGLMTKTTLETDISAIQELLVRRFHFVIQHL